MCLRLQKNYHEGESEHHSINQLRRQRPHIFHSVTFTFDFWTQNQTHITVPQRTSRVYHQICRLYSFNPFLTDHGESAPIYHCFDEN